MPCASRSERRSLDKLKAVASLPFDPRRGEWSALPAVPAAFSAAAGARLGNRMYIVGGDSPDTTGRQVYSYDVATGKWRSEAPLPAHRTNLAAVALHGKVYAIGGLDRINPVRTVFVFDPKTRHWSN